MTGMFDRPTDSPFVALTVAERAVLLALLPLIALFSASIALFGSSGLGLSPVYWSFIVYLTALSLPFLISGFRPGVFHPLVFYVLWTGYRSLFEGQAVLAATGLEYHHALWNTGARELNQIAAENFLLEAVALIALYLGYGCMPRIRFQTWENRSPSGLAVKSVLWLGVAAFGLFMLSVVGGGLDQVLMQRGIASDERISAQVGGQWNYLAGIGTVIPLVWLACQPSAIARPMFWVVVCVALAIKFAATGSRGGTAGPLIMIGAVWVLQRKRLSYIALLAGVVLVLVLVGMLGEYRKLTQKSTSLDEVSLESSFSQWASATIDELKDGVASNSGQIAILGRVPHSVKHLYGESYLSVPFIFVPSAIWKDKPEAGGKLTAERIYERPLTGIPPGSVGEAYWNFSYVGVVLVFVMYGGFLRLMACIYSINPDNSLVIIIFLFVAFHLQPTTSAIYGFVHAVIPAILIWWSFVHIPKISMFPGAATRRI